MIQFIKEKINQLYKKNQPIHIHIKDKKIRNNLKNCDIEVKIEAIYKSVFTVVECNASNPRSHSIQYVELLTRDVEIDELGEFPEQPKLK